MSATLPGASDAPDPPARRRPQFSDQVVVIPDCADNPAEAPSSGPSSDGHQVSFSDLPNVIATDKSVQFESPDLRLPKGAADVDRESSIATSVELVRPPPPWKAAVFALALFAAGLCWGFVMTLVLFEAYPESAEAAQQPRAAWFRVLVMGTWCLPAGVLALCVFVFALDFPPRKWGPAAGVVAVLFTIGQSCANFAVLDLSPEDRAVQSVGVLVYYLSIFVVPAMAAQGLRRRKHAVLPPLPAEPPFMKTAFIVIGFTAILNSILIVWLETFVLTLITNAVIVTFVSLAVHRDRPHIHTPNVQRFTGSLWYLAPLAGALVFAVVIIANLALGILVELEGASVTTFVVMTMAFGMLMIWARMAYFAAGRRALPPRHLAICLLVLTLMEDLLVETIFFSSKSFSAGFAALLLLHIVRTIGRDSGLFDDARRFLMNVWRRWRGEPEQHDHRQDTVDTMRVWMLAFVSELLAPCVLSGVLAAEAVLARDFGPVSGLDKDARASLFVGFAISIGVDFAAHLVCLRLIRRRIDAMFKLTTGGDGRRRSITDLDQERFSLRREAARLIRHNWLFILASLLLVSSSSLWYLRRLRADYVQ